MNCIGCYYHVMEIHTSNLVLMKEHQCIQENEIWMREVKWDGQANAWLHQQLAFNCTPFLLLAACASLLMLWMAINYFSTLLGQQ